jgi:hypothetical protein
VTWGGIGCAGVVASVLLAACGGSGKNAADTSTTGENAPIAATILTHNSNGQTFVDPDSENKMGSDLLYVVLQLPSGRFQLTVTNRSALGFVNSFTWKAPPNVKLTSLLTNANGHCTLSDEQIVCSGIALKPPSCTCLGDGGKAVLTFTAKQAPPKYGQHAGWEYSAMTIGAMTPVPYVIPSSPTEKPGRNADLPLCVKGQTSTAAKPCVYTG